jgi:hypothetical protein
MHGRSRGTVIPQGLELDQVRSSNELGRLFSSYAREGSLVVPRQHLADSDDLELEIPPRVNRLALHPWQRFPSLVPIALLLGVLDRPFSRSTDS